MAWSESQSIGRKQVVLIACALGAVLLASMPQAEAHGYYSATADGYEILLFTDPTETVAGQESEIMFYVRNQATGETIENLRPKASVAHVMDGVSHPMEIDAIPKLEIYYTFRSTFSQEGWNPLTISAEVEGKTLQFEMEIHVLPATGGAAAALMPGMPSWLIPTSAAAAGMATIVMVLFVGGGSGHGYRALNLLSLQPLARLVRRRWFP